MDLDRYSRQMRFAPIGREGQRALGRGRAAVVGCGALGTVIANGLVRAGVGTVRIIDRDVVELSNLQRQMLFDESDARAGLPKAVAAAAHLRRINSEIEIEPMVVDVTASTIEACLRDVDVVLDGMDNFESRYLVNDYCVKSGTPWIFGGAVGGVGQVMAIIPGSTSCLACVQPSPPPAGTIETCETAGILASASTVVGALEVAEAIKILAGKFASLASGLFTMDVWTGSATRLRLEGLRQAAHCAVCQGREFRWLEGRASSQTMTLCGRQAVQVAPSGSVDWESLKERLETSFNVSSSSHLLRFHVDGFDLSVFRDGRTIVKGTDDVGVARSIVARYLGA